MTVKCDDDNNGDENANRRLPPPSPLCLILYLSIVEKNKVIQYKSQQAPKPEIRPN